LFEFPVAYLFFFLFFGCTLHDGYTGGPLFDCFWEGSDGFIKDFVAAQILENRFVLWNVL